MSRPSRPTTRLIRTQVAGAAAPAATTTSLKASATSPARPGPAGQADLEVAATDPPQRLGQLAEERLVVGRGRSAVADCFAVVIIPRSARGHRLVPHAGHPIIVPATSRHAHAARRRQPPSAADAAHPHDAVIERRPTA